MTPLSLAGLLAMVTPQGWGFGWVKVRPAGRGSSFSRGSLRASFREPPMSMRMPLMLAVLGVSLTACSDACVTKSYLEAHAKITDKISVQLKFNTDPTAEISSQADGVVVVREGYAETLRGTVGDANHAIDELTVSWLVDGVDVCPDAAPDGEGLVTCDHTFAATGGEVLLEVRDPEGGSGSARVTVYVFSAKFSVVLSRP